MTNWVDDFDDDVTIPVAPGRQPNSVDDFDDDITMPAAAGKAQPVARDDFDDDLTTAFDPSATRWDSATAAASPAVSPPPAPRLTAPPSLGAEPWLPPQRPTAPPPPAPTATRPVAWIVAGATAAALLVAVIAYLVLVGGEPAQDGLGIGSLRP